MQATEDAGQETYVDVPINGNRTEMQEALSRYLPRFYRSAYRQLGNAADAEDAVQDAMLAAYKHLDQFKGNAQMSTWLTAIVTNCARMQLRRRPRQPHVSLHERSREDQTCSLLDRLPGCGPSPEDQCRKSELRQCLLQSLEQLSPSLRKAYELRDLDGRSVREAAHALGLAEGTVKSQLSLARAKLTRLMRRALRPGAQLVGERTSSPPQSRRRRSKRTSGTTANIAPLNDQPRQGEHCV